MTPKKQFDELRAERVGCKVWAYCPVDDWSKVNRYAREGYIDYGDIPEIRDFVDYILSDSKILVSFLFGDGYIQTGNDNDDEYDEHFGPEKLSSNHYKYFLKDN